MLTFIIKRLLTMIPMLFGISLLVFFLMYLAPGDFLTEARSRPDISDELVQQLERQYGLTDAEGEPTPWYVQYGYWLNTVSPVKFLDVPEPGTGAAEASGKSHDKPLINLGHSWAYNIPVTDLIAQRLPATLLLSFCSIVLAWSIAIPLGVLAAIYKDSIWDRLSAFFAYAALSIPEFFLALLAVYFATVTGLFPTGGFSSIESDFMPIGAQIVDHAWHLVLPTLVLGLGGVAGMMRIMRANFLDYMRADFVNTARAKGLNERLVMFRHVLRNAINPLITAFGFAFSSLLSGAVLVENVMTYPGLGRLMLEAFLRQDQYVVMAGTLIGAFMLMLGNLLADLLLAWSDPRIRLEKSEGAFSFKHLLFVGSGFCVIILLLSLIPWGSAEETLPKLLNIGKYIGGALVVLMFAVLFWTGRRTLARIACEMRHRPLGITVCVILLMLYISALFAPFLATHGEGEQNLSKTFHPPTAPLWSEDGPAVRVYENRDPSAADYQPVPGAWLPLKWFSRGHEYSLFGFISSDLHLVQPDYEKLEARLGHPIDPKAYPLYLLGSDSTGRDVFSRLLYGSQISLSIGLIGIGITLTMGFLVGGLSGYFGGQLDFWAMRLVEFMMAIPGLYLLLALRSALAPYFDSAQMYLVIIMILACIGWAGTARIIRGMSLSIRKRTFVLASESMGQGTLPILTRHILPNLSSYLLVAATLSIPAYILGEANLSFLGLGIDDPEASWGLMLKQAQDDMKVLMLDFWWMLLPGGAIFLTVIAYNLLGDVLRDIVDPKMKL